MLVIGPSGHPTTFAEEIPGTHCERYGRGEMGETGREQLGIGLHHIVSKLQSIQSNPSCEANSRCSVEATFHGTRPEP